MKRKTKMIITIILIIFINIVLGENYSNAATITNNNSNTIEQKDNITNIKLETTTSIIPNTTKLTVDKIEKGNGYNTVVKAVEKDIEKFVVYDISLVNNNAIIQPNGKVKISLPIPAGYKTDKIVVYRVEVDGTKTKYDTTVKDDYVTFETEHFSIYVLGQEKEKNSELNQEPTTNNGKEEANQGQTINQEQTVNKGQEEAVNKTTTNKEQKKDDTQMNKKIPQAGENDYIIFGIIIITALAFMSYIKLKKYSEK